MPKKGRGWHGESMRHSLAARGSRFVGRKKDLGTFIRSQTLENGEFFYKDKQGNTFVMESGHATKKGAEKRVSLLRKDGWDARVLPNGETVVVKVDEVAIAEQNAKANWKAWREMQLSSEANTPYGYQRRLELEKGYERALRHLHDLQGRQ